MPAIGWMPEPGQLLGEFEGAEEVVGVGQGQRRLPVGRRELGEVGDLQRAFEQRIGGVHVQMHEPDLRQTHAPSASPESFRIPQRHCSCRWLRAGIKIAGTGQRVRERAG